MAHRRGSSAADADPDAAAADASWKSRREEALRVLRQVFRHDSFRGKQEVRGLLGESCKFVPVIYAEADVFSWGSREGGEKGSSPVRT